MKDKVFRLFNFYKMATVLSVGLTLAAPTVAFSQAVPTPPPSGKPETRPATEKPAPPTPAQEETTGPVQDPSLIAKESARWHYERALVLNAQEKPSKALAALYRAFDWIDARRAELETAAKSKLTPVERKTLDVIERDAKDRRLNGSKVQGEAWALYREQIEKLAQTTLSTTRLDEWVSLKRDQAECSYLAAVIHARNGRAADAITALASVVDADPAIPEHVPARLLLIRSYQQIRAWERALPHLKQLMSELSVSDPQARKALLTLSRARAGQRTDDTPEAAMRVAIAAIDDTLYSEPGKFREATLGRKLRDPLVYIELADLFSDEEDSAEVESTLAEAIRVRGGFFPVAFLGIADLDEVAGQSLEAAGKKKEAFARYESALKDYDMAFNQMKALDFTEGSDLDVSHLEQLRKKIAALQPAATR